MASLGKGGGGTGLSLGKGVGGTLWVSLGKGVGGGVELLIAACRLGVTGVGLGVEPNTAA